MDLASIKKWQNQLICLAILLATAGIYAQVARFQFINMDDPLYVQARQVRQGLGAESLKWAFSSAEYANWMPLTRVTHIVDASLFGDRSGPVHVENAIVHALTSLMVFWFLFRATGARWPSAFSGLLFAVHPLHVESVVWASERKDVLCALFWFLTLWAWVVYAARPNLWRYLGALLLFCLGLISKPMIVSLPVILLLLDRWPLRRPLSRRTVLEKLPFAALSLLVCAITFYAQKVGGAVQTFEKISIPMRVANSLAAWLIYPLKTVWPSGLGVFYPFPKAISAWALPCGLALAAVSLFSIWGRNRFPWLTTGWFWYLVTTLPVIGLVQVGAQSRADRYMYIPMVGLGIVLAWGANALVEGRPALRPWIAASALASLGILSGVAWRQTGYWRDTETLSHRTIAVTGGSEAVWQNLGNALMGTPGRRADAIAAFRAAVRIAPDSEDAHSNLAGILLKSGQTAEADRELDAALKRNPGFWQAHDVRGTLLLSEGKTEKAIAEYQAAIRDRPWAAEPHANLGSALESAGQIPAAMKEEEEALRLDPDLSLAHYNLGAILMRMGEPDAAASEFLAVLKIAPGYAPAQLMLGSAFLNMGRSVEGLSQLEAAAESDPRLPDAQFGLATVLAQTGRTAEALEHARAAVRLRPEPQWVNLVKQLETQARPGN